MSVTEVVAALRGLEQAIVPPRPGASIGNWRFAVRQRLATLREALAGPDLVLDPRTRGALITRVMALSTDVLGRPDVETVRGELRRLVADVGQQAVHSPGVVPR